MDNNYWGYHLLIDATGCDIERVSNLEHIQNFVTKLVKDIDMDTNDVPMYSHYTSVPEKLHLKGYSFYQFIITSNISGHICEFDGSFYLDVFSCKNFNKDIVVKLFEEWFIPKHINHSFLIRQS